MNAKGSATIMVSKVSEGDLEHVKVLAFEVVKYLLDGIIDGEITDEDFDNFKVNPVKSEQQDVDEVQKNLEMSRM